MTFVINIILLFQNIHNFLDKSHTEQNGHYQLNYKDTNIDRLNDDCLEYIFSFLSVADRIRIERGKKKFLKIVLFFTI